MMFFNFETVDNGIDRYFVEGLTSYFFKFRVENFEYSGKFPKLEN